MISNKRLSRYSQVTGGHCSPLTSRITLIYVFIKYIESMFNVWHNLFIVSTLKLDMDLRQGSGSDAPFDYKECGERLRTPARRANDASTREHVTQVRPLT